MLPHKFTSVPDAVAIIHVAVLVADGDKVTEVQFDRPYPNDERMAFLNSALETVRAAWGAKAGMSTNMSPQPWPFEDTMTVRVYR